jgi:ADP-ribose pyrophosphatase
LNRVIRDEYVTFAAANPQLFTNPSAEGYVITLDDEEVDEAEAAEADRLAARGLPRAWARVGIVHRDQYGLLLRDAVRYPDGSVGTYIRFVREEGAPPGVAILPRWRDKLLLIRHFRHATRTWHLEIPRGFGTPGRSAEENARRELVEETGAVISAIAPLGPLHPDTGMSAEKVELFIATVEARAGSDEREAIQAVRPVAVMEFEHLIRTNEITDSFTIAAFVRARLLDLV